MIYKLKDDIIRSAYNLATKVVNKCLTGEMRSFETRRDCEEILKQIGKLNDEMIDRKFYGSQEDKINDDHSHYKRQGF
jgi:hypothetical protein